MFYSGFRIKLFFMARTKRASASILKPHDIIDIEDGDDEETKRLKKEPPTDAANFLCKLFENHYHENYIRHLIWYGKYPKFDEFPIKKFQDYCDKKG
jgi:hypothetical protein